MKTNIFAFFIGALSGIFAYILRSEYLTNLLHPLGLSSNIDLLEILAIWIPGFIFGLFSIPFIWYHTRSFRKTVIWFLGSGVSFIAAYWAGVGIADSMNGMNDLVTLVFSYTIAGLIGAMILVLTFRIILGVISKRDILIILSFGGLLPGILLIFFGIEISGGFISVPIPKEPYDIIMMMLWQGFMLFNFNKILNNSKDMVNGGTTVQLSNPKLAEKPIN